MKDRLDLIHPDQLLKYIQDNDGKGFKHTQLMRYARYDMEELEARDNSSKERWLWNRQLKEAAWVSLPKKLSQMDYDIDTLTEEELELFIYHNRSLAETSKEMNILIRALNKLYDKRG